MSMQKQTAKLIARIAENLPPMSPNTMQGWIENPKALQRVLAGLEKKTEFKHLINLDSQPYVPKRFTLVEHQKGGLWEFNLADLELYLSPEQQNGGHIKGTDLQKELSNKKVLNANVLDYLLEYPELIPKEWKGNVVCFWGTIYRNTEGDLYVRCLHWDGDGWDWSCFWLECDWNQSKPALVRA